MEIRKFSGELAQEWNSFLINAKNTTFLFNRNFMDYHKERFLDHSLMVYNEKGNIVACFPANQTDDNTVWSHQGLTYGAIIFEKELKLANVIEVFQSILSYYNKLGIKKIILKQFPRFYNISATDEIEYCLFLLNAKLYRKDTAITVDRIQNINYSGNIRREAKKAEKNHVAIYEDQDFENFWDNVLTPNLQDRFGVNPVHSVEEIKLLKECFPKNIRLFTAKDKENSILAGTLFFIMDNVAHCQYISASNHGRNSGALNYLFVELLDDHFKDLRFVDFGIVNEDNGKTINAGMLGWKERLGGRTYAQDFYEIDTSKHTNLNFE
jgi:hypothetical protein